MPRLLPDDAPPERIGGLLGGKWTAEVGRREQQAFHASAGIAKGGSAQRVTRRGRHQSHVRGVRYRLGPRESQPRRWIGGGRMYLLGEITHQTRASGEVAAPVTVVAQPFGCSGPGWVGLWLMRQSSTAAAIVGRDEFMQFGGPSEVRASGSGRRALAARDDCAGWGRRVGGEPGEELLGDLVEGGELCLAEHVVRRAAQGLGSAGPRSAVWAPGASKMRRVLVAEVCALSRRRMPARMSIGGRGVQAVDAGEAVWLNCSVGEVDVVLRSSTGHNDMQGSSGLGAGQGPRASCRP